MKHAANRLDSMGHGQVTHLQPPPPAPEHPIANGIEGAGQSSSLCESAKPQTISAEQLRGLTGLHRVVALALIEKGRWRLAADKAEMVRAQRREPSTSAERSEMLETPPADLSARPRITRRPGTRTTSPPQPRSSRR